LSSQGTALWLLLKGSATDTFLSLPIMSESALIAIASIAALSYALYGGSPIKSATSFVQKMVSNPQIAELFRFIFLGRSILNFAIYLTVPGTILETGRKIGQTMMDFGVSCKTSWFLFSPC
jgi:hypothetical protein